MTDSKEIFKHDNGYLVFTENSIFLTTSDNWSEMKTLNEKSEASYFENRQRLRSQHIKTILISTTACILLFFVLPFIIAIPVALIVVPMLIATIVKAFRTDYGNLISIPLSKIKKMDHYQNQLTIYFINGDSIDDSVRLTGLDIASMSPLISSKFSLLS